MVRWMVENPLKIDDLGYLWGNYPMTSDTSEYQMTQMTWETEEQHHGFVGIGHPKQHQRRQHDAHRPDERGALQELAPAVILHASASEGSGFTNGLTCFGENLDRKPGFFTMEI